LKRSVPISAESAFTIFRIENNLKTSQKTLKKISYSIDESNYKVSFHHFVS